MKPKKVSNKESKTMLEVWEVKERLSSELLKLPVEERIPYIIGLAHPVTDVLEKKKVNRKRIVKRSVNRVNK